MNSKNSKHLILNTTRSRKKKKKNLKRKKKKKKKKNGHKTENPKMQRNWHQLKHKQSISNKQQK
jgi:hypothetical protein